ncbi:MAG: hypothetical protein RIF36_21155 [Imperialibacter sp.]|uniref:hypothetical protein n=1 Tax=Imperialibacter sp. TaxID=2038411 RepID=UPI0032EB46B1
MSALEELIDKINWTSFWEEQINAIPYFIIGIVISVWVIPYFTIRGIEKKNLRFINSKTSFIVFELCEFLSRIPEGIRQDGEGVAIFLKGKREFVALLRPNLLDALTLAKFERAVLDLSEVESAKQHELVTHEHRRLMKLRDTLERLTGFHSLHIQNQVSNEVSDICYEIRKFEDMYSMNLTYEELLNEKVGKFGILQLRNVYVKSANLVSHLIDRNSFEVE